MQLYTAPVHFDADGLQTVGGASVVPAPLPRGSRLFHPEPVRVMIELDSDEPLFAGWDAEEWAKVPPEACDPSAVYAHLLLEGEATSMVPDRVWCLYSADKADASWERVRFARIPADYWRDYATVARLQAGCGRFLPADARVIIEAPAVKPASPHWKPISKGLVKKAMPHVRLR